ncbi:hypothetical protein RHMOL_Rhmol07G0123200 [Rhododendron molle]|uniref:Uncharacterized protein n=1 Tax=Rhododendron molle TaxID=49168 RepID=A0ACC0MZL7_RHOML|nr:hypothetical protein RHMOL_Rhmol07G0123200 [Rhododendron molle]
MSYLFCDDSSTVKEVLQTPEIERHRGRDILRERTKPIVLNPFLRDLNSENRGQVLAGAIETLRMESLTTYASDEEEPKSRHCEHSVSPATEFEKPKFKRLKVSAVCDFPACLEQINAQRNSCGDDSDAEPREIDHVEPLKNTLHPEKDDSSFWSLESNGPTDDGYYSEDFDDATYNDPFEVLDRERSCKLELQYVLTKVFDFANVGFKRPKVSAIRDFPVAFEQFGAQANGSPCSASKVEADVASDPE